MAPTTLQRDTLATLSALSKDAFVARLGDIFEHSPWVAERAWEKRPFTTIDALHGAMVAAVDAASEAEQLALICAHPELAGKEAAAGTLTRASTGEQKGAGLDQCSAAEYARLTALNAAYRERFGFPFIVAVRGHTRQSIIDAMAERLQHAREAEIAEALRQIGRIAAWRLADLIG